MKKYINVVKIFLLGILFSSINFLYAQTLPDWENPDVNGINKEKPYAYSFLASEKANNPTVQSLNGIWKFKWSPDPQSRPMDFYTENYSTERNQNCRKTISVNELRIYRGYKMTNLSYMKMKTIIIINRKCSSPI